MSFFEKIDQGLGAWLLWLFKLSSDEKARGSKENKAGELFIILRQLPKVAVCNVSC